MSLVVALAVVLAQGALPRIDATINALVAAANALELATSSGGSINVQHGQDAIDSAGLSHGVAEFRKQASRAQC